MLSGQGVNPSLLLKSKAGIDGLDDFSAAKFNPLQNFKMGNKVVN